MVKVTEIVAGFMLLVGIFPALATLFLAPVRFPPRLQRRPAPTLTV
jgi:hypothetical protein